MVVYTDNCLVDLFYNTFMVRWL